MKSTSPEYVRALVRIARQPSRELKALGYAWPKLQSKMSAAKQRAIQDVPKGDPIRSSVDLLTPLRRVRDENVHTRALAFLLDPKESHGLGDAVLKELLTEINGYGTGVGATLRLVAQTRKKTTVCPEYRYRVEGFRDRSIARCDIWIEILSGKRSALVIIENKIGAPEGKEQLGWYEKKASQWFKKNNGDRVLVFLTADERHPQTSEEGSWINLPYVQLARALRRVWADTDPTEPGRAWLGLYIASLMRGILQINLNDGHQRHAPIDTIRTYIGRGPS